MGTYDRDHRSNHATGVVQEVFKDIERSHAGSARMKHGLVGRELKTASNVRPPQFEVRTVQTGARQRGAYKWGVEWRCIDLLIICSIFLHSTK